MAAELLRATWLSLNKATESTAKERKSPSSALERVLASPGVKNRKVTALRSSSQEAVIEMARSLIDNDRVNDPFYVLDLTVIVNLWQKWQDALPRVQPFYAVNCNRDPALLAVLAALGAGFACVSWAEIEAILKLGVSPDRIVYANPCKAEMQLKYAANVGVNLTTFDSVEEVAKIKKFHPQCSLLLRVNVPDNDADGARCPVGRGKYGALPEEVEPLLRAAQRSGLAVAGVSFHIDSGVQRPSRLYAAAVGVARGVFDSASRLGLPKLGILNIGCGFTAGPAFREIGDTVRIALQTYFPDEKAISVIGEPDRYFAESAFLLATKVIGKRERGEVKEYWINDGVYGSMSCLPHGKSEVTSALPLACKSHPRNIRCTGLPKYRSSVYGQTCADVDIVLTNYMLPDVGVGDWLVFPNMGAYTSATSSNFNGFAASAIQTYCAAYMPS